MTIRGAASWCGSACYQGNGAVEETRTILLAREVKIRAEISGALRRGVVGGYKNRK